MYESTKGVIVCNTPQPAYRAGTLASHIYKAEKPSVCLHLTSHVFSITAACIAAIFVPNQALFTATPSLLKEISNRCCLLSTPRSTPGFTYIPVKTIATTALLLACTTLKPKVQGSNPAYDIFSSHYHIYVLMLACESAKGAAIVCN